MLHITGVRKIGRRCLLMSVTGLAWEQAPHRPSSRSPRLCSAKLLFSTAVTGQARISAYSFNNHLGTPSGPVAFLGLSLFKAEKRRAPKGLAVGNPHWVTGGIQAFGRTALVVGMQSRFGWKSLSAQTEEWNPRSVSWQTRSLSQERGQCQRSALSGSILKRSSRYGELYACN